MQSKKSWPLGDCGEGGPLTSCGVRLHLCRLGLARADPDNVNRVGVNGAAAGALFSKPCLSDGAYYVPGSPWTGAS